jgi:23S rRNA (guanine745-N1)-methyltransferase
MKVLEDKRILSILRCPICAETLYLEQTTNKSLRCNGPKTHCYDIAGAGYVNLCSPSQSGGGDSKQAVRARSDFLNKDYYRPVADALCEAVKRYNSDGGIVLDAGCGEGYYSSAIASSPFPTFGIDISKFATEAAAKRAKRTGIDTAFFATASVFEMPVQTSSVSVLTSVFAPCAEEEFARVLKNDGVLIVALAGENHLMGLKKAIYKNAYVNTERADLPEKMEKIDEIRVSYNISLDSNEDIINLFSMTPYYWRTSPKDAEKLNDIDKLDTEVDIILAVYKNTKEASV